MFFLSKDGGKLSSVKRLLVLGIVQNVPENYFNVKTILNQLNLEALEFTVSADIKMRKYTSKSDCVNIFIEGLQSFSP